MLALEDDKPEQVVNELDAAYEAIPESERQTWYKRANRALEKAGMPEWMRITPTVKEMTLRLWVGSTVPGLASGLDELDNVVNSESCGGC